MSSQSPIRSQKEASTQKSILANDNLTLATKSANTSIENAVQLKDDPSQTGSVYERHVFSLVIAYSEIDVLAKFLGVSVEVSVHAKSLYSQVYNYSDFDGREFQHDTLIAACIYIACSGKNQPRTMPEVFKSTNATNHQMLTVCGTLKAFLAAPPETPSLLSKTNKRLQFAYEYIGILSNSVPVPPHASDHAEQIYTNTYDTETFEDDDHRPIIASCLLISCYQLNVPQNLVGTFANDHGITKDLVARTLKSLEAVYATRNSEETKATPEARNPVTSTAAGARSTDQIVNTLQEMIQHLNVESDTSTTSQQRANIQATFKPTAPTRASIATSEDDGTKTGNSPAPNAPSTGNIACPFHSSPTENIISTTPPIEPAAVTSRKYTRALRKTLYNVICCQCKKILNLQNIHYTFQCVSCKHKRCDECTMEAI